MIVNGSRRAAQATVQVGKVVAEKAQDFQARRAEAAAAAAPATEPATAPAVASDGIPS